MRIWRPPYGAMATVVVWLFGSVVIGPADAAKTIARPQPGSKIVQPKVISAIDPASKDWVNQQLIDGKSVMLTNSYLFQIMKGVSQENQKRIEENVLIPVLADTLKGLVKASKNPQIVRLFGIPLILLTENPGIELPDEVVKQAEAIKSNPMFSPRGHYTDSKELENYFRAMQFLSKATINVAINERMFPFPKEMLFPFETALAVHKLFSDPKNKKLVQYWRLIHVFYSRVNGAPDLPTFLSLPKIIKGGKLDKESVKKWAKKIGIPRINPETGLGIQPFGERFTVHALVIDRIKKAMIKDDTTRERIAEILRFDQLLVGLKTKKPMIAGLDVGAVKSTGKDYYHVTLKAISVGADGWRTNPFRKNFYAASLTGLAEQTALMAKTSTFVRKSAEAAPQIPDGVKLYFEPDSEKYLLALADAAKVMTNAWQFVDKLAPKEFVKDCSIQDIGPTLEAFAELAAKGEPLVTGSDLWKSHGPVVTHLQRPVAVTVDVFRVKDPSGKVFYYQWAIAPFVAAYSVEGVQGKVNGLTAIFFETWGDIIMPGSDGPLNNLAWRKRILEGSLDKLPSIVPLPAARGEE